MNSKQIVYLSQTQYAELIANGSITVDGVTVTYDENDIYVTPQAEPVTDVRVAGTSVAANGVAAIPVAGNNVNGVVNVSGNQGLLMSSVTPGLLMVKAASSGSVKSGADMYNPIVPSHQGEAAFYGLAKAAGHDEASSIEPLGTYTPEAKGAIQSMLGVSDLIATAENNLVASKAYAIGDVFTANGKLYKATAAIAADAAIITDGASANCEETSVGEGFVKFTDYATNLNAGIIKVDGIQGITIDGNHVLCINNANINDIKAGTSNRKPIVASTVHEAAFYGLAKAAGDTSQTASSNAVGIYTDAAKEAIRSMLGIDLTALAAEIEIPLVETVTGTDVTINGQPNVRYNCGEVSTITINPPAAGSIDVIFTSGTSIAVLTLPSTVKMPVWFDATALETDTIYEILITDGTYGSVMTWPV